MDHDRLYQHELMRRELERKHTMFPLVTRDQPDTAERKRLEMQSIPFALPPRRKKTDDDQA